MNDQATPVPATRLGRLTPGQRETVFAHCGARPASEGVLWLRSKFNFQISERSLRRWLQLERGKRAHPPNLDRLGRVKEQAAFIRDLLSSSAGITLASSILIAQTAFEELLKPPEDRDEKRLTECMRFALQAWAQEIKDKAVDLNISRFQFDAAKAAMREQKELQKISEENCDESEKIEKVIELLFGKRPAVTDLGLSPEDLEVPA
jgi:hypothetical protein